MVSLLIGGIRCEDQGDFRVEEKMVLFRIPYVATFCAKKWKNRRYLPDVSGPAEVAPKAHFMMEAVPLPGI